jgi:2-dehydro-3-deoxyphosphogluconate aldolase/(4S)-4-hydroxy-2-oxoglutarate aldolase
MDPTMPLPDPRPLIGRQTVIPVLTIRKLADAVPLARALARGGLPLIEVTLRTPIALEAIAAIAKDVPEAIVGAGTITAPHDIAPALAAGSQFLVSPGTPRALAESFASLAVPVLPGCATISEAMTLQGVGFAMVKFFPAEPSGGAAFLKAASGPLPDLLFCPTGGITLAKAPAYLALPNVPCLGGSWIVPDDAVNAGDWARIETLAAEAAALSR